MADELDPRMAYIERLQDAWMGRPPASPAAAADAEDDDPREAYLRRLTRDGVPHHGPVKAISGVRLNDSGVVQFTDSVELLADFSTLPMDPSNLPTTGAALRQIREARRSHGGVR